MDATPSASTVPFSGELVCPDGEEAGWQGWDYGASIQGTIDDPIAWVEDFGEGLHPELTLSFVERAGDRDHVVTASSADGRVLMFLDLGRDGAGSYFPVEAEACPSSGLEGFEG